MGRSRRCLRSSGFHQNSVSTSLRIIRDEQATGLCRYRFMFLACNRRGLVRVV